MFSNTAKSSASDNVNTRPKWKAYLVFMAWIKNYHQKLALLLGYLLVASLFYGLGRYAVQSTPSEIKIEEPELDLSQVYDNLKGSLPQITGSGVNGAVAGSKVLDCGGKIKGNISASGRIYHLPGGAFYKRTNPEICFDTEEQARAAGFRKSSR